MTKAISLSISALGGQGGGVLSNWIVDLAQNEGYVAQSTSVPGVAQRTGATIYYLEIFPRDVAEKQGQKPVLAQMPTAGDVDICIASELMEAGRAVARNFVDPGQTTLIASNHRAFAISEKENLADGRIDSHDIFEKLQNSAKTTILFDMEKAANDTGSMISTILFGALAGSGALPFPRAAYEKVIRDGAKAVEANLRGFAHAFEKSAQRTIEGPVSPQKNPLREEALRQVVEYQDKAYGDLFLARLKQLDQKSPDVIEEVVRTLSLWMMFEDVIRVAGLKTRAGRMDEIREEVRALPGQIINPVEFFHPRWEELCDTLPAFLGKYFETSRLMKFLFGWMVGKGRQIDTFSLRGFLPLYFVAGLKGIRRWTLRYQRENATLENWLNVLANCEGALALEVAKLPRILKGYGATRERGTAQFEQIMRHIARHREAPTLAEQISQLSTAALSDEEGTQFKAASSLL